MPSDHDALLRDWRVNAVKEEDTNFRFLRSLKMVSDPERIDAVARKLHEETFGRIDCTRCANCCKTMPPGVSAEDIERIAKHLHISQETFTATYLVADREDRSFRMRTVPCPFLGEDDHCTIYPIRPEVCREFPHTAREGFVWRTYLHAANTQSCPAVYHIVKRMRHRQWR